MKTPKTNTLFSYAPSSLSQKIWRVCPDAKSEFIVIEVREIKQKNTSTAKENYSQLVVLDSKKKEVVQIAEMEATQSLVHFHDQIILLSQIDIQNEMPLPKGIKALNLNFETIWEIEEVIYYCLINAADQANKQIDKVIFSLQTNYYSVPLKLNPSQNKKEVEATSEEYTSIKDKEKQYFYSTKEYSISHLNYIDISSFIFDKTKKQVQNSILYTENELYLLCSYLIKNTEDSLEDSLEANFENSLENKFENYLLCTDKQGIIKKHIWINSFISTSTTPAPTPQEVVLFQDKVFWILDNELQLLFIN